MIGLAETDWVRDVFDPAALGIMLGIVAVVGVFGVAMAGAWQWGQRERAVAELKRDMVNRGMSVGEIERVIAAGADQSEDR
jgi:hypothetical protein